MAIALYARKSIERENSISCETQIEYCRAMIKPDERNEQVMTFVDNGFSWGYGSSRKRPGAEMARGKHHMISPFERAIPWNTQQDEPS